MPAGISRPKESEIIRLYLQGASQTEMAKKAGVSQSTASKSISEFKEDASKSSLDEACSRRGLGSELNQLRSLSVDLRKTETTVSQAKRGCRLVERLTRLGADLDKLEQLLALCDRITPKELSTEDFVQAALRLVSLEKQSGKGCREILSEFEDANARVGELGKKIEELNRKLADVARERTAAEAELETRLNETRLTTEKVEATIKIRENLQRAELSIEKGEIVGNMLAAFSDLIEEGLSPQKAAEEA